MARPGVNYTLEGAVLVEGVPAWTDLLSFTMVNSWQFIELPGASGYSLFRIRQNPTVPVRLDMLSAIGPLATLRLHGKPGTNYIIEARTSLGTNIAWIRVLGLTLTNTSQAFSWTNAGPPTRFFRGVEGSSLTQPFLMVEEARNHAVSLRLNGLPGGLYLIESANNLGSPVPWTPVQHVTLTNSTQRFSVTNHGEPVQVFRARVN